MEHYIGTVNSKSHMIKPNSTSLQNNKFLRMKADDFAHQPLALADFAAAIFSRFTYLVLLLLLPRLPMFVKESCPSAP